MGYAASLNRGVSDHYGPRDVDQKYGSPVTTKGLVKQLIVEFDYDDLPSASFPNLGSKIPANASIVSTKLEVITGFTSTSGTTDLQVGVADADGGSTITDVDALVTAAEGTQTAIATAGNIVTGAGAGIGVAYAEAAVVTVTPNVSDLTAGRGRIIVEFIENKPATYTAPTGT